MHSSEPFKCLLVHSRNILLPARWVPFLWWNLPLYVDHHNVHFSKTPTLKKRSWTMPHWRPHSSGLGEYTSCLIILLFISDFNFFFLLGEYTRSLIVFFFIKLAAWLFSDYFGEYTSCLIIFFFHLDFKFWKYTSLLYFYSVENTTLSRLIATTRFCLQHIKVLTGSVNQQSLTYTNS